MKFRTLLPPLKAGPKIGLQEPVLTIGSCFAEGIGHKLAANKFKVLVNPFGTIFDPLSVSRLLTASMARQEVTTTSFIRSEGLYKSLELHSSFAATGKGELQEKIKARLSQVHDHLRTARWLLITFGTAYIYKYLATGKYIANCQKLPARSFQRELVPVSQLQEEFRMAIRKLQSFNPGLGIILTVSPVRHLKDGLEQNSLSKAVLRCLCHELASTSNRIIYYPAYELMMDDLRDYRFYKEDMLHPTEQAIDYIWQHFSQSFFTADTLDFLQQWQKLSHALQHKAFNPASAAHQQFLQQTLNGLNKLKNKVDVTNEIKRLKKQIRLLEKKE